MTALKAVKNDLSRAEAIDKKIGQAAQAMAVINNLIIGMVLKQGIRNLAAARKRYGAYLLKKLNLISFLMILKVAPILLGSVKGVSRQMPLNWTSNILSLSFLLLKKHLTWFMNSRGRKLTGTLKGRAVMDTWQALIRSLNGLRFRWI